MFVLNPDFETTSAPLMSLALCAVRLHLDARYPWLVLIPRREGAGEVEDLTSEDQVSLIAEIVRAGRAVRAMGEATGRPIMKLNIGLLGNVTPQLHAHVVGRRDGDEAWPGPVWGQGPAILYDPMAQAAATAAAISALRSRAG
jgi:diadenosine tetraphosphate (Ap4A) HIT family hydrolase